MTMKANEVLQVSGDSETIKALSDEIAEATGSKDFALVLITPLLEAEVVEGSSPISILNSALGIDQYGVQGGFKFEVLNEKMDTPSGGAQTDQSSWRTQKDYWESPGWRALMLEALNMMLKKNATIEMVDAWLDSDDECLQQFCIDHSKLNWPMGIGLIEAAMELVDGARGNANIDDDGNLAAHMVF